MVERSFYVDTSMEDQNNTTRKEVQDGQVDPAAAATGEKKNRKSTAADRRKPPPLEQADRAQGTTVPPVIETAFPAGPISDVDGAVSAAAAAGAAFQPETYQLSRRPPTAEDILRRMMQQQQQSEAAAAAAAPSLQLHYAPLGGGPMPQQQHYSSLSSRTMTTTVGATRHPVVGSSINLHHRPYDNVVDTQRMVAQMQRGTHTIQLPSIQDHAVRGSGGIPNLLGLPVLDPRQHQLLRHDDETSVLLSSYLGLQQQPLASNSLVLDRQRHETSSFTTSAGWLSAPRTSTTQQQQQLMSLFPSPLGLPPANSSNINISISDHPPHMPNRLVPAAAVEAIARLNRTTTTTPPPPAQHLLSEVPRQNVPTSQPPSAASAAAAVPLPVILGRESDSQHMSGHQAFLRQQIELFEATEEDVTNNRGRHRRLHVGQVGIRCKHCADGPSDPTASTIRQHGSRYFPAKLDGLYQAAQNMSTNHIQCGLCNEMPDWIKERFKELMPTKNSASRVGQTFWANSARDYGLIDTDHGIYSLRKIVR